MTDLYKMFKTDEALEKNGIWIKINDDGPAFKVRRFGGFNSEKMKPALAKYFKPYAKQIELGTLPSEKEREITVKVWAESSLVDWKNVQDEAKKDLLFSQDNALKILLDLPELFQFLLEQSRVVDSYREDLGNS